PRRPVRQSRLAPRLVQGRRALRQLRSPETLQADRLAQLARPTTHRLPPSLASCASCGRETARRSCASRQTPTLYVQTAAEAAQGSRASCRLGSPSAGQPSERGQPQLFAWGSSAQDCRQRAALPLQARALAPEVSADLQASTHARL